MIPHSSFVIEKLDIDSCIGAGATSRLQAIIQKEAYVAPASVSKLMEDIASTKRQLQNIISEFNNFGIEYDIDEDKSILSIEYSGNIQIDTTEELKRQLSEIEKIVHAYARLTSEAKAFSKPSIVSLSKSSPLVIDIGDGAAIALALTVICKTITWIMNRVEQVYDIRIKREQLRKDKLSNDKIEEGFEELILGQFSDSEVKEHVNTIYKGANPSGQHGSEAETKKALVEAVKALVSLIDEQGANVKVFVGPEEKDDNVDENVVDINNAYLRLEKKQKDLGVLTSGEEKRSENDATAEDGADEKE